MKEFYNKEIFANNLNYLLNTQQKPIGELEQYTESSPGYPKRLLKDNSTKPVIDFLMGTAEFFGISLNTLLYWDVSQLTNEERRRVALLEKLIRLTWQDKLGWHYEEKGVLNEGLEDAENIEHPLFEEVFYIPDDSECEDEGQKSRYIKMFNSRSFGKDTIISGDCYNYELGRGIRLYIMRISKWHSYWNREHVNNQETELLLVAPDGKRQFFTSTQDRNEIADLINELYLAITESLKHPVISEDIKLAITEFLEKNDEDLLGE